MSAGTGPPAAAPPPVKVCSRCRAQSQTWGNKCPACGRRYNRGGLTVLKVAAGVILGLCVLIVGCAALLSGAAHQAGKQLTTEQNQHAITNHQARSVHLGTPLRDVEARFGSPKSTQESQNAGVGSDTCIYYNVRGGQLTDQWQFCFTGHGQEAKLTNKNRL